MSDLVVLVRPENIYHYNNYPPLNLICLGSALQQAGFDVAIVNAGLETDALKAVATRARKALLVGISLLTSEAPSAQAIMAHLKRTCDVPIAVGGWHTTLFPHQMAAYEHADYVIAGEGEHHIVEIARALRDGTTPHKTVFPKEILDLNELPAPNYDLDPRIETFVASYLTDKCSEVIRQPMRWLPYESSRGCPSRCTFCINVVADNQRYRKKSAAKVIEEVTAIVRKYRLTHVKFLDDNFFVDIQRVRAVAQGMIDAKLDVTWDAECRCDYFNDKHLNDETLALCRRSGLIQLTLGIESGSPHTLELMKKGITPEQAENAVARCDAHDVIPRSSFILEIPGETLADIKQTISFVNRLRKYPRFVCGVNTFRPYPKCELTEGLISQGYLKEPQRFEDWSNHDVIEMYTAAEYEQVWQVDGRYSQSACLYLNMESARGLRNSQITRRVDRLKNSLFMALAKLRNRLKFYSLPVDRAMYQRFLKNFYKRRQDLERAGEYPMPAPDDKEPDA